MGMRLFKDAAIHINIYSLLLENKNSFTIDLIFISAENTVLKLI